MYKCDNLYDKPSERCIHYLDKTFNMDWPIKDVIISDKDKLGLTTEEYENSLHKVLITGASGLLGSALKRLLEQMHFQVLAPSSQELDVTRLSLVDEYLPFQCKMKMIELQNSINGVLMTTTLNY